MRAYREIPGDIGVRSIKKRGDDNCPVTVVTFSDFYRQEAMESQPPGSGGHKQSSILPSNRNMIQFSVSVEF